MTIDGTDPEDPSEVVGQHTALIVASNGTVHIAYSQNNYEDVLLWSNPVTGASTIQTMVEFGSVGMYNSIAEGPSGLVHIVTHERVRGDLIHTSYSP